MPPKPLPSIPVPARTVPRKILVVDDNETGIRALKRALRGTNLHVVSTHSPFEFAELLKREKPDLALVDVNLPAINGDKIVSIARMYDEQPCPLVLYSARAPHELEALVRDCGAAGWVYKSGDSKDLVRQLERYLPGTTSTIRSADANRYRRKSA
ncbi:MAG: response regulator [Proteobacteria bacterium]|nr:response regulator [Pseudomonadota bacterium]